jgi:hypothetical protein
MKNREEWRLIVQEAFRRPKLTLSWSVEGKEGRTVLFSESIYYKEKESDNIIREERRHPTNYRCNYIKIIVTNNSITFSRKTQRLKTYFPTLF